MTATAPNEPEAVASNPAERAFEGMERKLAGLSAAVDGFAARQQELHARDYRDDLAKIHDVQERFREAINTLNRRPGLALTPDMIASQIERAGMSVRSSDHAALESAKREFDAASASLKGIVASARSAEVQRWWLIATAALGTLFGIIVCATLPGSIARSVPEKWYWPEAMAAGIMRREPWDAGTRLLAASDSERLKQIAAGALLQANNVDTIGDCRARAARVKRRVSCRISVDPLPTG